MIMDVQNVSRINMSWKVSKNIWCKTWRIQSSLISTKYERMQIESVFSRSPRSNS